VLPEPQDASGRRRGLGKACQLSAFSRQPRKSALQLKADCRLLKSKISITPGRADALHLTLKVVVYVSLYFATAFVLGPLLYWLGGYIVSITATGLLAAAFSNSLCLRIYVRRGIAAIGLQRGKGGGGDLG